MANNIKYCSFSLPVEHYLTNIILLRRLFIMHFLYYSCLGAFIYVRSTYRIYTIFIARGSRVVKVKYGISTLVTIIIINYNCFIP